MEKTNAKSRRWEEGARHWKEDARQLFKQTTAAILVLGASMNAYAGLFGLGGTSWKEEVLLHDDTKIVVERYIKRYGKHEVGQRPPIGEQSLAFVLPETNQRVVWKDEYSADLGGANFNLMMLDIMRGSAYLLATPAGCFSYNKWGRPNPPYVILKLEGDEWRRISIEELPTEIVRPNLLFSSPDDVAARTQVQGIVPATAIQNEFHRYRQPEFRSIVRKIVKRGTEGSSVNCEEMVRYKCGWVSPHGDAGRKFMDRNCK